MRGKNMKAILLALTFLMANSSLWALTCPEGSAVRVRRPGDAEVLGCVDNGGRLKVSSVTFNGVDYNFPASDGAGSQFLKTDGAGNVSWATPSGAGHTIADDSAQYTQRSTVQFSGAGFSLADDSAGDATVISMSTAATPEVFKVVSSSIVSGDSSLQLSNLSAGENFQIKFSLNHSASTGELRLEVNSDSGTNYYEALESRASDAGASTDYASTLGYIRLIPSARNWGAGAAYGFIEFSTDPSDDTIVSFTYMVEYVQGNGHKTITRGGGTYDGASAPSTIKLVSSNGTITGNAKLLQLDTVTAVLTADALVDTNNTFTGDNTHSGTETFNGTTNLAKIPGQNNGEIFGGRAFTTAWGTNCTGTPCGSTLFGSGITSITRASAGQYTINFSQSYSAVVCAVTSYNASGGQFTVSKPASCTSCSSVGVTTANLGATILDTYWDALCMGY